MRITIELNEREASALLEMAARKDLPPQRVMIQALRTYQLVDMKMAADPEWMQDNLLGPRMPKMAPYCVHERTMDGGCPKCDDPSY